MYIHEQTTLYVFAGQSYKNLPYFTCQRFLCKSLYLRDLLPPCDLFCLVHTTLHLLHTHPLSLASMSLMISSRWLTKDTSSWRSSCSLCCCVDDFCQSAAETRGYIVIHLYWMTQCRWARDFQLFSWCWTADRMENGLPAVECKEMHLFYWL